jgi:hypothetical protein
MGLAVLDTADSSSIRVENAMSVQGDSTDAAASLTLVRSSGGHQWQLDGVPLLSRTIVEVQFASGRWISRLFLWSGKIQEPPVVRLLLANPAKSPTPVDIEVPGTVVMRRSVRQG